MFSFIKPGSAQKKLSKLEVNGFMVYPQIPNSIPQETIFVPFEIEALKSFEDNLVDAITQNEFNYELYFQCIRWTNQQISFDLETTAGKNYDIKGLYWYWNNKCRIVYCQLVFDRTSMDTDFVISDAITEATIAIPTGEKKIRFKQLPAVYGIIDSYKGIDLK